MKRAIKNVFAILVLLASACLVPNVNAGVEPVLRNSMTAGSIRVDSFKVIEDIQYTMSNLSAYNLYQVENFVTVEINQEQIGSCYLDTFSFWVNVEITGWDEFGTPTVDTGYFQIFYDQRVGQQYKGIHTKKLSGFYKLRFEVISLSNTALTDYIRISGEIAIERYKTLDTSALASLVSTSYSSTTGDITVNWSSVVGAEEYDLEYTFVDDYALDGSSLAISALAVDFRDNATRVTVKGTSYKFSNVFERGYVVFRARPASYTGANFTYRIVGKWSDYGYDKKVDEYSTNERIAVTALEPTFNWQYVNTFSEWGKRKELISFMDGSFRNRQSVTRVSSDTTVIIGESVYDHQGRPALQVLPVPEDDTRIKYYPDFNMDSISGTANYSRIHFDTGVCDLIPHPMKTTSGANKYYSSENDFLSQGTHWLHDQMPYIPQAKGMAFVRTIYTDDNSGRVAIQSGVGEEHAIGSTHETKYYYGTPYQEELDRLFGNSVGFAKHYQKQMVVDPNGQVSVSYTDLSGKVIATALAGGKPDQVTQLSNNTGITEIDVDLVAYQDEAMPDPYTTVVNKKINVSVPGEYRLNYILDLTSFSLGCMQECYECVYDLTISITDECGEQLLDGDPGTGGIQSFTRELKRVDSSHYSVNCLGSDITYASTLDDLLSDSMRVTLGIGSYTISKTLTVSEEAANYYADRYLQDTSCLLQEQEFIDYYNATIDDFGCETTCEECSELLADSVAYINARKLVYEEQGYVNGDMLLEMVTEEFVRKKAICAGICNQSISPCEFMLLTMEVDVAPGGQYEELLGVITAHPEYCRYEFCDNHQEFARFDLVMDSITDGNWAIQNGYMNPLETNADFPVGVHDTFFYNNSIFKGILIEELDEVLSVPDIYNVYHDLDVWQSAIWVSYFILGSDTTPYYSPYAEAIATNSAFEVMGGRCYLKDPYLWEIFRALYKVARSRAFERILADSACSGMSIPAGKEARFMPLDDIDQLTGGDESSLEANAYAHCEAGCDSMSGAWMQILGECVTEHEDAEDIRLALVAACAAGCGPDNPMGSSAGFKAVLESYGIYEVGKCDPTIITVPTHTIASAPQEIQIDTTAFDCLCHQDEEECVQLDVDPEYLTVLRTLYYAPKEERCDTLCIECNQLRDTLVVFLDIVGDSMNLTDSTEALAWQNKLTVFFNAKFGTKNTFAGYLSFMEACLQLEPDSLLEDTVVIRFLEYTDPVNPDYSDGEDVEAYLDSVYEQLDIVQTPSDPFPGYYYSPGSLFASVDLPDNNGLFRSDGSTLLPYTFAPASTGYYGKLINPCVCKRLISFINSDTSRKNPTNSFWSSCGAGTMNKIFRACFSSLNNEEGRDVMDMNTEPWTGQDSLNLYNMGKAMNLFLSGSCADLFDCPFPVDSVGPTFSQPGDTSGYHGGAYGPYPLQIDTVKDLSCDSLLERLKEFILATENAYIPLTDSMKMAAAAYIDSVFSGAPYYRDAGNLSPQQKAARLQAQFEKCVPKESGPPNPCSGSTLAGFLSEYMYCSNCVIHNAYSPLIKRWLRQETQLVQITPYDKVNLLAVNNHPYVANSLTAFYETNLYTGPYESMLVMTYQKPMSWTGASPKKFTIHDEHDSVTLELAFVGANETINFISNIRGIKSVHPVQSGCSSTFAFRLEVIIEDFEEQVHIVDMYGSTNAYELYEPCVPDPPTMCSGWGANSIPSAGTPTKCNFDLALVAESFARRSYQAYLDSVRNSFVHQYKTHCIQEAYASEAMTMRFNQQEYHYTLYYYDLAGNLIQTVPPAGVDFGTPSEILLSKNFRKGIGTSFYPTHLLPTNYQYNSLNELKWQATPDGGVSHFWYDRLGRLVVSRNAKQKAYSSPTFSYTRYDALGRIQEVGEVVKSAPGDTMTFAIAFSESSLLSWINSGISDEITRTYYDERVFAFSYNGFSQNYLRNRVSSTTYTTAEAATDYQSAVHYDYDVHGNVKAMVRETPSLDSIYEQYKVIRYEYELVSGNVLKVLYQQDSLDRFFHKYEYDADNRVIGAYTSSDQIHWDRDAKYTYYLHGPLARTELGELRVQGMDYAYTLHGWLKGINSERLITGHDIGKDGNSGSTNQWVCADEFGFGLGYFEGDYSRIGTVTTSTNFIIDKTGSDLQTQAKSLYNGNISSMVTAIGKLMSSGSVPFGRAFQYDQLNRIMSSRAYNNVNSTSNVWNSGGSALAQYATDYTYDANGNILTLLRKGKASQTNMDNLTYHYYSGTNRLAYVDDAVSSSNYGIDIDDQWVSNYEYDEIGNLIADSSEQIDEITWTVYGKIQSITRTSGSSKPDLQFEYTPDGYRSCKHVIDPVSGYTTSTWYVRDASGNIMATYEKSTYQDLDTTELDLSTIVNILITDNGPALFASFMTSSTGLNISTMLSPTDYSDFKTYLATNSLLQSTLEAVSPLNILNSDPAVTSAILGIVTNSDFYDAMSAYYGGAVNYATAIGGGPCYYVISQDLLSSNYFNFAEYLLMVANPVDVQALWDVYFFPTPMPLTMSQVALDLNGTGNFPTLYHEIAALVGSDLFMHYESYMGPGALQAYLTAMPGLVSCTRAALSDNTCVQIMTMHDEPGVWDLMQSIYTDDYLADKLIAFSPNDFLLSGLTLDPTYWIELLETGVYIVIPPSTIKYTYKVSIEEFFEAIKSFSPLGEGYLSHVKNQLIGLGYIGDGWIYSASEHHMYGSSRVGVHQTNLVTRKRFKSQAISITSDDLEYTAQYRGKRHYELSNHLGNVQVVVSDKRISVCDAYLEVAYFKAEVLSAMDYYPFGMMMPDRQWYANSDSSIAVNGFNGMRNDHEINGHGNALDFGARIYDSRLGRFLSVDPLAKKYPYCTPYSFAGNSPILLVDRNGEHPVIAWLIRNFSIGVVTDIMIQASINWLFSENHSIEDAFEEVDYWDAAWNGVTNSVRLGKKAEIALNGGYAVARGYWENGSNYTMEEATLDFLIGGGAAAITDKLTSVIGSKGSTYVYKLLKSKGIKTGQIRSILETAGFGKDVWHWEADGIVSPGAAIEMRGNLIEDFLSGSKYTKSKGFTQTDYSHKYVDFVSIDLSVSVKSVNKMDKSWVANMKTHITDLKGNVSGNIKLDIQYNGAGYNESMMQELIDFGKKNGVEVVGNEFK